MAQKLQGTSMILMMTRQIQYWVIKKFIFYFWVLLVWCIRIMQLPLFCIFIFFFFFGKNVCFFAGKRKGRIDDDDSDDCEANPLAPVNDDAR